MLLLALTAAAALVPSLLLMAYFHSRDLFPEPPRVLWRVFGLGVAILVPLLLVVWPVRLALAGVESPLLWGFATAFLEAAVPEELFKFGVIWWYALRRREFDEPFDGVVYGVAASLGFATIENVLYVADAGLGVAVVRAFTAVPAHAFVGALMGYYAGRARLASAGRGRLLVPALAVPTLLHGLYDFPLLAWQRAGAGGGQTDATILSLAGLVPAIVLAEWLWAVRIVRRLRADQDRLAALAAEAGAAAARPPGRTSSVAMVLGGAAVVCAGAFMGLAVLVAVLTGGVAREDLGWAVAAAAVFALAPAAAGGTVFGWGIRRLNQRGRLLRAGSAAAGAPSSPGAVS